MERQPSAPGTSAICDGGGNALLPLVTSIGPSYDTAVRGDGWQPLGREVLSRPHVPAGATHASTIPHTVTRGNPQSVRSLWGLAVWLPLSCRAPSMSATSCRWPTWPTSAPATSGSAARPASSPAAVGRARRGSLPLWWPRRPGQTRPRVLRRHLTALEQIDDGSALAVPGAAGNNPGAGLTWSCGRLTIWS
jgi:hypothetical protein